MKRITTLALAIVLLAAPVVGNHDFSMPVEQRVRFRNKRGPQGQGSCVYASCAKVGAHHGIPSAEFLLENHPDFGPPVLDGSWPERLARDFAARKHPIDHWNVTGSRTIEWIDWALDQGKWVAITYGVAHMITATGRCARTQRYWIVDNNFPQEERLVSREVFLREHRRHGGGWAVILKGTSPPPWERADAPRRPR